MSMEPILKEIDDVEANISGDSKQLEISGSGSTMMSRCADYPGQFRSILRCPNQPKGKNDDEEEAMLLGLKKEEARAYKELVEALVSEERIRLSAAILLTLRFFLLAIFVLAIVVTANLHVVHAKWLVLHLRVHRWVALLMVVISGLPCIRFLTLLVSEPLVWLWKTHRYAMLLVRKLKRKVDVTLWSLLVLWVWYTWFRSNIIKDTSGAKILGIPDSQYKEDVAKAVKQVTRLLMALTLGAFLWTLNKALYLRLISNLHYIQLCPMIRQTILDLHAIQFITHEKGIEWSFLERGSKSDKRPGESLHGDHASVQTSSSLANKNFWMNINPLNKKTTPIWILKELCFMYIDHMKRMKPLILSDLEDANDDDKFMEKAKTMYDTFSKGGTKFEFLSGDDMKRCGIRGKEVDFVYKLFQSNEDGTQGHSQRLTNDQFLKWAVQALKGCLRLERVITTSKPIFVKLKLLLNSCVVVLVLVIWLLISDLVTTAQLALLFTPFISASFIFGESLKRLFDGLIFVFGMHPFDVDQRVIIENTMMKVTEMKILTTTFFVYESGEEAIYPNSNLSTMSITKLDLIKNMTDSLELTIPVDTPKELITDLEVKIKKSLDDKLVLTSETMVAKKSITENDITLIVHFKYLVPYHSSEIKARHKSEILDTVASLREKMKRMKKEMESRKDLSEVDDIVMFQVESSKKLVEIEELMKNITNVLQDCESSKECSKVLFSGIDQANTTLTVHIGYRKDLVKPGDKEKLKSNIQSAIRAKGGHTILD